MLSGFPLDRRSSLGAQRIVALSSLIAGVGVLNSICVGCELDIIPFQTHGFQFSKYQHNLFHLASIHLRVWFQYLKWWGGGQAYACLCLGPPVRVRMPRGGQNKTYYDGLYVAKGAGRTSQRVVAFEMIVCVCGFQEVQRVVAFAFMVCVCGFAAAPASETLSHSWYVFELQRVVAFSMLVCDCSLAGVPASESLSHAWCVFVVLMNSSG